MVFYTIKWITFFALYLTVGGRKEKKKRKCHMTGGMKIVFKCDKCFIIAICEANELSCKFMIIVIVLWKMLTRLVTRLIQVVFLVL